MKFLLVSALALGAVSASPLADRAAKKCYTVHSGELTVFVGDPGSNVAVGVNNNGQVTYGKGDPALKVEFQACPATGTQYPNLNDWTGRIVKTGTSDCVTVTNPSSADGPYFLKVSACKNNTVPINSQYWEYGNDFGAVVFWEGPNRNGEIGYTVGSDGYPVTESGTGRIQLGCAESCASFNVS